MHKDPRFPHLHDRVFIPTPRLLTGALQSAPVIKRGARIATPPITEQNLIQIPGNLPFPSALPPHSDLSEDSDVEEKQNDSRQIVDNHRYASAPVGKLLRTANK
jgi:hypothetical protein